MNKDKVKFIDNHSHIIPNVDDGSCSIKESVEIAKQAFEQGIEIMYATPHLRINRDIDVYCNSIKNSFIMLKKALVIKNIDIRIIQGYEVYANRNIIYEPNLSRFCFDCTDYMLVEVNPNNELAWLVDFAHELQNQGIKIILAHPERYKQLQSESKLMKILDNYNVLYQINSGSILGYYGRKTYTMVKKLIKKGHAHLIGTDVHNTGHAGLDVMKSYKVLCRWIGESAAQDIAYNNAKRIIIKKGI